MYYDGSSHCSYKLALRVSLWQPLGFCNTLSNFLVRQQFTVHIPYYMKQSPSWAANRFSASKKKNPPHFREREGSIPHSQVSDNCPYPEPDQSSPCPPLQFLKTHLNIILPSTPASSKRSLSFTFPHQHPVNTSPLSHMRYMSRPTHSSRFDHPINIWWRVQITKLLIMSCLHSLVTSSLLGPNILLSALLSNTLSLRFSLNVRGQVWHSYKIIAVDKIKHYIKPGIIIRD